MRLTQQEYQVEQTHRSDQIDVSRRAQLWRWLKDDAGAVAIEYVIVAIALLAIAGAIAAALTSLGDDAVEKIPASISDVSG
ncbi:MAG: hypothetical protein ACRBK7_10260 [Acidimicrobiales bacterium]